MRIHFKSGSFAHVGILIQRQTYGGLMAGLPNAKLNQSIIKSAIDKAHHALSVDPSIRVIAIAPVTTPNIFHGEPHPFSPTGIISYETLPAYETLILLESIDEILIVSAFTDSLGIDSDLTDQLRDIDWKRHATPWGW